jgi:glutathione S-transferase
MRLIGRFLSPFVRRVAIALELYGLPYGHSNLSVVDDRDEITAVSRLSRIPCLVLDDGETLIDSHQILAELDRQVGPERALLPKNPNQLRAYGQMIALLTGSLEKGVATVYELARRPKDKVWPEWGDQLRSQLVGGLLEAEARAADALTQGRFLFGDTPTHADVAGVLAYGLAKGLAPGEIDPERVPRLAALAAGFGARPEFEKTQPS